MDKSRLEIKVGLFVLIGLVLLAGVLIQFSKGTSLFRGTYELRLHAVNVGGLKPRAGVLLAGVEVGSVSQIKLAPDGKSVTIVLRIYKDYPDLSRRAVCHRAGRVSRRPVCFRDSHHQQPADADEQRRTCTARSRSTCRKSRARRRASSSALMKQPKNWTTRSPICARMVLNGQTLTNFAIAINNMRHCFRTGARHGQRHQHAGRHQRRADQLAVSNAVFFSSSYRPGRFRRTALLATNGAEISAAVQKHRSLHRRVEATAGRLAGRPGPGRHGPAKPRNWPPTCQPSPPIWPSPRAT